MLIIKDDYPTFSKYVKRSGLSFHSISILGILDLLSLIKMLKVRIDLDQRLVEYRVLELNDTRR